MLICRAINYIFICMYVYDFSSVQTCATFAINGDNSETCDFVSQRKSNESVQNDFSAFKKD